MLRSLRKPQRTFNIEIPTEIFKQKHVGKLIELRPPSKIGDMCQSTAVVLTFLAPNIASVHGTQLAYYFRKYVN